MSVFLSRVGRFAARHRLVVLGGWLLIVVSLIGLLAVGSGADKPAAAAASASASGTDAARTLDKVREKFPSMAGKAEGAGTLQLVFEAPDGSAVTDPAVAGELSQFLARASELPGVTAVSNPLDPAAPYISPGKDLAVSTLTYEGLGSTEQKKADYQAALDLRNQAPDNLRVELGGNLLQTSAPEPGSGELIGVLVAFLVLLVTFGSLRAAGSNLFVAAFGVGVGLVGIFAYGAFFPVGDTVMILAAMLGLAVGIDYSLFIFSRFRTELREGRTVVDAVARAMGTAGTAVVFAGMTVLIALAGLSVVNISVITEMGLAAAFAVLVAVLMALTLLPVMMRTLGLRVLPRKERNLPLGTVKAAGRDSRSGFLAGWAMTMVKRPVLSILGGVVVLAIVALPALDLKTAYNIPGGDDPTSTQRAAYNLIQNDFGGVQSPLIVLAEGESISAKMPEIGKDISAIDGVQKVVPGKVNAVNDAALLTVIPNGSPVDDQTKGLVKALRNDSNVSGVTLEVTGEAVIYIDEDARLNLALIQYLSVIIVLSLVLLTIMFRSVLVPVIATLGFLLSVAASFGGSVAVFQWGWLDPIIAAPQGDPMLSLLPILLVGVLFGLAMDYQVFLVSRIREMYSKGLQPKDAIVAGFTRSAPVLIAAGTIMAVVFAGFASSPMAIAASISFGLVVGVVADVFIVRLVLMPALLAMLGTSAWWLPRWMDRIIPDIDTEGHILDKEPVVKEESHDGELVNA